MPRPVIGIGIGRCVPEQGKVLRKIRGEGQRVNTRIGSHDWPYAIHKRARLEGCAIRQSDSPARSRCRLVLRELRLSSNSDIVYLSRLLRQVSQQGQWVNAPFIGEPHGVDHRACIEPSLRRLRHLCRCPQLGMQPRSSAYIRFPFQFEGRALASRHVDGASFTGIKQRSRRLPLLY